MMNFRDWLLAQEDSPFGRTRRAAALGTGPDIPLAGVHGRSTASGWIVSQLTKGKKKVKKAKRKKKKK
jgi:hypothetical protein